MVRSRRKYGIRRGPNWLAAIEKTSRVTEKISASTVLTAPRLAPRIALASSTLPTESQDGSTMGWEPNNPSRISVVASRITIRPAIAYGTGMRFVPGTAWATRLKCFNPTIR